MPKFMGQNDSLDVAWQFTIDHRDLTACARHIKALAGPLIRPHRRVFDDDIHGAAHLFGVICLIFHFKTVAFSFDQLDQQISHLIPELHL